MDRGAGGTADQRESRAGSGRGCGDHVDRSRPQCPASGPASTPPRSGRCGSALKSHPYAVKPTSTLVAEAIGAVPNVQAADWQFACKAGTEAMVAAIGFVGSGMANYALAIGMDTAQGSPAMRWNTPPGRAGQLSAGPGGRVPGGDRMHLFISSPIRPISGGAQYQKYPEHGQRFTGEPAYFKHITEAGRRLMEATTPPPRITNMLFSTSPIPNSRSGRLQMLGFTKGADCPRACWCR